MKKLIDEYIALKKEVDAAKLELEALGAQIKQHGPGTYEGNTGSVTVTTVAQRNLSSGNLSAPPLKFRRR